MRPKRFSIFGLLISAILVALPAAAEKAALSGVAGKVLGEDSPLSSVRVYAYQISDADFQRVVTDERGGFHFDQLPVGLYKVIAHKKGFVPAVVMLTRATADAYQYVEVRLAKELHGDVRAGEDFWSVRAQVPPDVLRDIGVAEVEDSIRAGVALPQRVQLQAEMRAMTGVGQVANVGDGQLRSGGVGLEGRVGNLQIDVDGDYRQLNNRTTSAAGAETSALSFRVANGPSTEIRVSSTSNRMNPLESQIEQPVAGAPVDFENYRVSVSQSLGQRAHSEFAAQYTSENGFHRHGWIDPANIPEASESWRLEGTYAALLTDSTQLETGFSYRERRYESDNSGLFRNPIRERVELFGRGGSQVQPAVFVEYGLYTTLRDGSLSLAPRGGLVINLGDHWKASTLLSHTVHESEGGLQILDFAPVLYGGEESCANREEFCYQVVLSRANENTDSEVSFGAVHRKFSETLRLYFSEDFFDRLESLYMVPGDELPEVQFSATRRLSPQVLARFESNLATGGGGIFYATDREAYENSVRYLVTSMDTQFQRTDTGLFVAFHHLQQELSSVLPGVVDPVALELDRLQVMLTQDLNLLLNLTQDWAFKLNMELSRGSDPFQPIGTDSDELRKRFLGGVAVKF